MKKVIQVAVKEPQYVVSTDVAFAQVDAWFGHTVRDLKLDVIYPEPGAALYDMQQPHHPVCVLGRLPSAARVCHICGHQIICPQLQQGVKPGIENQEHLRDVSLSRTCKNRIF